MTAVQAYYPEPLPPKKIKIDEFKDMLIKTSLELGRFDGMIHSSQHKMIIKNILIAEEVLSSASLEVREMEFEDYLNSLLDTGYEADDLVEIRFMLNYYQQVMTKMSSQGFSIYFLNELQSSLYQNRFKRRLSQKMMYRQRHPWLVDKSNNFDMNMYLHPEEGIINKLLENLNNFVIKSSLNPFITAAIAFAQLVLIHPWRYANYRTTNAMMPFLLNYLGLTKGSSFFISSAFSQHKQEYFNIVYRLFTEKTWNEWINFFLQKTYLQAINGQKKIDYIQKYYIMMENDLKHNYDFTLKRRHLNMILSSPIFTAQNLRKKCGFTYGGFYPYLEVLQKADYIIKDNRERHINYMLTLLFTIIGLNENQKGCLP